MVSRTPVHRFLRAAKLAAALVLSPGRADAHELEQASATLVVRSGGHLELRLQVPWAEVLRQLWGGGRPLTELLGQWAADPLPVFSRRYGAVTRRLADETYLVDGSGRRVIFLRWRWPAASEVQQALRQELMSRLADGTRFTHASRLTATAEVTTDPTVGSVRLALGVPLGAALVTVVRPEEQWIGRGQRSAPIALRPTASSAPPTPTAGSPAAGASPPRSRPSPAAPAKSAPARGR